MPDACVCHRRWRSTRAKLSAQRLVSACCFECPNENISASESDESSTLRLTVESDGYHSILLGVGVYGIRISGLRVLEAPRCAVSHAR
eukprot:2309530-Prymnesium_polylepis.4